ncbi:uncharacterized protein Bfra_005544 [Botrytis fragariae]|uniref:Uncharacterized protein n=1 Tax=Botrytis fragariae TaxID=1964551 RepID=A0A8H6EHL4_9HELO|nr:uncharacterized protein Bfra_005544 [Botrytis fragariae]KAF5872190.1 hypothetical protein Bfra_005544 [Botrytis fragariae]
MSLPGESLTSQSSTPKILISPSFHNSPPIILSKEDRTNSYYPPKPFLPLQADPKTESAYRNIIQTTQLAPSTPGLDVWISGISNQRTLEMLGYPSSNPHISSLASNPSSPPNTPSSPTSRIQKRNDAITRPLIPASSVLHYLLDTAPRKMHININGCKRSSQVEDNSEDYAILRYIANYSEPRYWVFDIEDLHCAVCCKQMRDQRRRAHEKSWRWSERVRGAWRHQHCVNSWCHGACGHERRSHNVLTRLGLATTRKIKYIQLTTSSARMDPDILASAITVLKPFVSKLAGLEVLLVSSSDSVFKSRYVWNGSRQEARRFICCFAELEEWLVEGARLEIKGLGKFGELEDMWWDVRRKWWRIGGRVGDEK